MDFRKEFTAKLINLRPESFKDRQSGETMRFYRVDMVGDVDGVPQALQLTCGDGALSDDPVKLKPGQSVNVVVIPFARNNRVTAKMVSLTAA